MQQKIDSGIGTTPAVDCIASLVKNPPLCNAAFCHNSLITCFFYLPCTTVPNVHFQFPVIDCFEPLEVEACRFCELEVSKRTRQLSSSF